MTRKKVAINCCEPNGRAEAFELIQGFVSGLRNGYRQFAVTHERLAGGGSRLVIESNGLVVGEEQDAAGAAVEPGSEPSHAPAETADV